MAGNFADSNCRVVVTRLTSTAPFVCHTAAGYTQIIGIRIVNIHATAAPIINLMYKPAASATTFFYQANYPMPVSTALWYDFDGFGETENDQIIVQASVANAVDVFVTIVEVPGRSQ